MSDSGTDAKDVLAWEWLETCAHDLRGALAVISGYAELLKAHHLSEADADKAIDGISAAVGRADAMLGQALAKKRAAEPSARRPVEISALLRQAADDCIATTGHAVAVHAPQAGALSITTDAVAVARILANLLTNAAKYAPDGDISISARQDGDCVLISVADEGPGIPAHARGAALRRGERLWADQQVPGSGLGLAIVSDLAKDLGGSVRIGDSPGGGATVTLSLPLSSQ